MDHLHVLGASEELQLTIPCLAGDLDAVPAFGDMTEPWFAEIADQPTADEHDEEREAGL